MCVCVWLWEWGAGFWEEGVDREWRCKDGRGWGWAEGFWARKRHDWIVLSIVDLVEDSLRGCRRIAHQKSGLVFLPGIKAQLSAFALLPTSCSPRVAAHPHLPVCHGGLPAWSSLPLIDTNYSLPTCCQWHHHRQCPFLLPSSLPPYLLSDQGRCDHQLALLARLNFPVCTSTSMMPRMPPSRMVLMMGPASSCASYCELPAGDAWIAKVLFIHSGSNVTALGQGFVDSSNSVGSQLFRILFLRFAN